MIGLREESGLAGGGGVDVAGLMAQAFAAGGWLQTALNLEHRPQQEQMATAVADAFLADESLLFEAGTGVGKSMAYLLPAIIHATERQRYYDALKTNDNALATVVRPNLFDQEERENGKAAWLLGASFITEGAIPFAAADPLRVIPSIMAGSAVTGGLSMAFDVTLKAPHGGIFVFFAVGNVVWFLVSLAIGVAVTAASVIALKQLTESKEEIDELAYAA